MGQAVSVDKGSEHPVHLEQPTRYDDILRDKEACKGFHRHCVSQCTDLTFHRLPVNTQ